MNGLIVAAIAVPAALLCYAYVGYPACLLVVSRLRRPRTADLPPPVLPSVTILLPCHNEEASVRGALEALLVLDYPPELRQILVVSDASTDRTDEIVRGYAPRGVELLRLPMRGGKTAAENAATPHIRGEIVVTTDATTRIPPGALVPLIGAFGDPTVGVASGTDVSVGSAVVDGNRAEAGYVGYEMAVRNLETRVWGIVGASGCFFGIRTSLHRLAVPADLSRDFASCLVAREAGYRSVSVDAAVAHVPRAASIRVEYRRKVRTMSRGLATLWHKRALLNPARYGAFAWMLASHKLCRWLFQLSLPLLILGMVGLGLGSPAMTPWLLAAASIVALVLGAGWYWPPARPMPRLLAAPTYFGWSNLAGFAAWVAFLRGRRQAVWEPTRRP